MKKRYFSISLSNVIVIMLNCASSYLEVISKSQSYSWKRPCTDRL